MPELPDVEALRRFLVRLGVPGRRITAVDLRWPRAVREPSPGEFVRGLEGRLVRGLARRAKFLLFRLDDGHTWIVHLRMTGNLALAPVDCPYHPHTRNAFHLDDGRALWFLDQRKLGQMWLVGDEDRVLAGLGPEPLAPDLSPHPAFTPALLAEGVRGRRLPIKALLMEQSFVAGLGNIYADEVLFSARLHPLARADRLERGQVEALHRAIVTVLAEAVLRLEALVARAAGPPTESEEGVELLRVPRREGAPCTACGAPVCRVPVRGRSTYFCPRCQGGA